MSRAKVILAVQTDDGAIHCTAGYAYDIEIEVKADRVDYWGGGGMRSMPGPRSTRTTIEWAGDVITGFKGFNFDDVPGERLGITTGPGELT